MHLVIVIGDALAMSSTADMIEAQIKGTVPSARVIRLGDVPLAVDKPNTSNGKAASSELQLEATPPGVCRSLAQTGTDRYERAGNDLVSDGDSVSHFKPPQRCFDGKCPRSTCGKSHGEARVDRRNCACSSLSCLLGTLLSATHASSLRLC
jgi:hypothetical protein